MSTPGATVDNAWRGLLVAIARGQEPNLKDTWRLLQGDRHGLELGINRSGIGAPGQAFCRCKVHTFHDMVGAVQQASRWWPDASYVRLNPSAKSISKSWHAVPTNEGTGKRDIAAVEFDYYDADPPGERVEACSNAAQLCVSAVLEIRELFAAVVGPKVLNAFAFGFSGRGAFGLLQHDPEPNTLETATRVQETYAGLRRRIGSDRLTGLPPI